MKRITFESDGYWAVDDASCFEDRDENYCGPAIDRLAAYEDTGLEPDEVRRFAEDRRWIPVTEQLPESGVRVIVCRGDKVEQGVFLGVNGWWKVYGTNTKKVTHWMPLPEPPKGE